MRGAPAIAIVAALSLASELSQARPVSKLELSKLVLQRLDYLVTSRPTAVNLANMAAEFKALVERLEGDASVSVDAMRDR